LLKKGGFVFLLDGLDEVHFDQRQRVEHQIEQIVRRFEANSFVLTTRPADQLPNLPGFSVLHIQPLSLGAAKQLISNSAFDEEVKQQFIGEMDTLVTNYRSFLSNPLLTVFMLLLFKDVIKIPSKKKDFYAVTFDVLFYRHDSYKPGRLHRKRYTNLTLTEFKDVFSVFCAFTYAKNEYTFFAPQTVDYLQGALTYHNNNASPEDLRKDLHESVAMLQRMALGIRFLIAVFRNTSQLFFFRLMHISIFSIS
jgi:predicted NACHT family NTPase